MGMKKKGLKILNQKSVTKARISKKTQKWT